MRFLKNIAIIYCFLFVVFACNNNKSHNKEDVSDGYIEIIDAAGRDVKISKSSKFIVGFSKADIFRILDAESKIEGVSRWVVGLNSEINPVLSKLPSIGGFSP